MNKKTIFIFYYIKDSKNLSASIDNDYNVFKTIFEELFSYKFNVN
jgi:hypothetical protein